MNEYINNKQYESLKIPERKQFQENGVNKVLPQSRNEAEITLDDEMFCEIEYDTGSIPGAMHFAPRPQRIDEPEKDEKRILFGKMRDIARDIRSAYGYSRFFDRRVRHENEKIFYKQGMFMKDFTDDYDGNASFSQYFPYYQMMGYEQLRTYFTWRTRVRQGDVSDISLSYAFLYVYELLANIGVENPQDGLESLMFFWKAYGEYNKSIDKYVLRWLKDYFIYYELPLSWGEFVETNNLAEFYPKTKQSEDDFDLLCAISKYDMRKSAFFTDETKELIINCFTFVMERIRRDFLAAGMHFDDSLFRPTRRIVQWKPFKDALFYHWLKQPDRKIVLSENELYVCKNNEWTFSTIITTEKGKQFIGYVMKQMESVLRKVTKYKYKLTANINMVNEDTVKRLTKSELFIEKIVPAAVLEFYREATKTVVRVDHDSLARIRREALVTQESLIVDEQIEAAPMSPILDENIFADSSDVEPVSALNIWEGFKNELSEGELQALSVILQGGDIKAYAKECGIMLEVLIDGINEKAMDYIGDNLMDEDFVLYEEYISQIQELIK